MYILNHGTTLVTLTVRINRLQQKYNFSLYFKSNSKAIFINLLLKKKIKFFVVLSIPYKWPHKFIKFHNKLNLRGENVNMLFVLYCRYIPLRRIPQDPLYIRVPIAIIVFCVYKHCKFVDIIQSFYYSVFLSWIIYLQKSCKVNQ